MSRVPRQSIATLIAELDARLAAERAHITAEARRVRRSLSRDLRAGPQSQVYALAAALTDRDATFDRFIAAELLAFHPQALQRLTVPAIRRLGRGMNSWGDVDIFACLIAGPAWRLGSLPDSEVQRWARSADPWWRRAAVVSTVALNSRARGGVGDPARTLVVCELVLDDSDLLVRKALSWALRELAKRDARTVRRFLSTHGADVPALVRREVTRKLDTGRKAQSRDPHRAPLTSRIDSVSEAQC